MRIGRYIVVLACLFASIHPALAQRNYAPHSVLATGNWYQFSVKDAGVYKIDISFLNSLGINTNNIPSASIRIFGNGGRMLPEANNAPRADDLREVALRVLDGGDGVFNGTDQLLFYATGPDEWVGDSVNQRFRHRRNLYSDKAYYFLSIGGNGLRINNAPTVLSPVLTVTSFSERSFHELDSVNFLAGSKEWYGEEFSNLPGRSLTRNFSLALPSLVSNTPVQVMTSCVARSAGTGSRFDIRINNQPAGQLTVNSVGTGLYDLFAQSASGLFTGTSSTGNVDIGFTYVPGSVTAQGWLNWFEVFARRSLSMGSLTQLSFRDWASVGNSAAEFVISNAPAGVQVWEVTDPSRPALIQGNSNGNEYRFVVTCNRLREYVAFTTAGAMNPIAEGALPNQDLHATQAADYLIVAHPSLLPAAQRLAALHRQQSGLRVVVVSTQQVFREFGSGSPDPVAIRDFVKMYYDKYGNDPANRPQYLLLFGDASYDYKNRISPNTNLVPCWQNDLSLDPLSSYSSDDFFGFLDDQEDINSGMVTNLLDIGIGRIPARDAVAATYFADKLENYLSPKSLGPWRNNLCFVADDEDNNLHLQDAETITGTVSATGPVFNVQKIYLDAYRQESGAGGSRYPLAEQASNNAVFNGTLIWNYNGHGGSRRLAEETILDETTVDAWNNADRLPLFITATCDVAPFDNPAVSSLGENMLLRPKTGGIALLTTTRLVFAYSNRILNNNYLQIALQPDAGGQYKTLGQSLKEAKNFTYQSSSDISNNRKFTLLGDPALRLAFPRQQMRITRVNGKDVPQTDTLSAMENTVLEGEVTDNNGRLLDQFNGTVYPVVWDKARTIQTLANDPGSQVASFSSQANALFKGKASVRNGRFSFRFNVPRDINYQYGNGKISLYAEDGRQDARGYFTQFVIGGIGTAVANDRNGPVIRAWLNDELFVNGGLTNPQPVLLLKMSDSSGINITGTGIGHDIVATLDNDNRQYFILNDFFEAEKDSYQQGTVRFQLPELSPGPHSLKIKAWDVLNNSGEVNLDFTVANEEELRIEHVLNYPNPFTSHTRFWFEHNQPGQPLQVQVQVMTIGGRIVKTFSRTIVTTGNRSDELEWDGRDEAGQLLGRGVYLYRLRVKAPGKKGKEVVQRLVIL